LSSPFADDAGQFPQAHLHGRLIAPLARDDLVAVATLRRTSGSMIPFSAIDAISSDRSPITWRGWFGLGSMMSMGTMRPTGTPQAP
jgi:hypothetical protein